MITAKETTLTLPVKLPDNLVKMIIEQQELRRKRNRKLNAIMDTTEKLNSFYKNAKLLPGFVHGYIALNKVNDPRQEDVKKGIKALIEELTWEVAYNALKSKVIKCN